MMNLKKKIRNIIRSVKFYLKLKVRISINLVPLHQPMPTSIPTAVTINQKSVPYVYYHLENSKLVTHLYAIIAFVWNVYWSGVRTLTLVLWIAYPSLQSLLENILMAR